MTKKDNGTTSYSQDIVIHLKNQGRTLKEIGKLMKLSEVYISYVKQGKKRLTLDRLKLLEEALGISLPLLLLKSVGINKKEMSEDIKKQYTDLQKILILSKTLD